MLMQSVARSPSTQKSATMVLRHRSPASRAGCIAMFHLPSKSIRKSCSSSSGTDTTARHTSPSQQNGLGAELHATGRRRLSEAAFMSNTSPILRSTAASPLPLPSGGVGRGRWTDPEYSLSRKRLTTAVYSSFMSRLTPQDRWNKRRGFWETSASKRKSAQDLKSRPRVKAGTVSPRRPVPDNIPKTPYFSTGKVPDSNDHMFLHTPATLATMREACVIARQVLDLCCSMAAPGLTTDDIDAAAHEAILKAGACPSPLNYLGFPKSVCSSVNEVACHAIPDDRPLEEGDLVSFDVSVFHKGYHGDNCATVGVGKIDEEGQRLIDATKEGMLAGVAACLPGGCLTDVGNAIHEVADEYGYDIVKKYCGHGVGPSFHMFPFVQHFRNSYEVPIVPGMTFTVEPIFTEGSEVTDVWSDKWTVQTRDGGRAAQFEHVVLITDQGHEILTVPKLAASAQ